jgi:hypothetical protein
VGGPGGASLKPGVELVTTVADDVPNCVVGDVLRLRQVLHINTLIMGVIVIYQYTIHY